MHWLIIIVKWKVQMNSGPLVVPLSPSGSLEALLHDGAPAELDGARRSACDMYEKLVLPLRCKKCKEVRGHTLQMVYKLSHAYLIWMPKKRRHHRNG